MPYPRYQGNNDYGRGDSRDDRRGGGYNQNQSSSVNPWGNGGGNLNQGFGSPRLGPSSGPGALLPTPGNRLGQAVDPMALVGNLMGAVGAMAQQNNPLATLANQLALAQAMQNKAGGNMGGGMGDMGGDRGGGIDLRHDRSRQRHDMGRQRTRDRSPIARRSSRRSRSRDRRRTVGGRAGGGQQGRDRSREKRAEHEIYIGNYPVRFRESDVRKLFEDHGISVTTIRLKHDGLKVFAFAETESLEMIEKAKDAMEGKEINGRKLRVRSSKDKSEREADRAKKKEAEGISRNEGSRKRQSRGTEREVGREDIKKYLVAAFIDFMDREVDAAGEDAPGEYKGLMDAAKKALAAAYSLPEDDSFRVNKELEDIFLGSVRREIKLPEMLKDEKNDEKETNVKSEIKVDEDADDDGNWKRRKVAKDDEDEEDAIRKDDDDEEETVNEQEGEENDDDYVNNLDEVEAEAASAPEVDDENEEVEDKMVEDIDDEKKDEDEDEQDDEESEPSEPSYQPTEGGGRGVGRSSRSSRK